MPVESVEALRRALEESAADRLLGTFESSWVDFKGQPYPLDTNRGAAELCKDVAALANAAGGCIVVGIATEKPDDSATERACELRPVPITMANRDQHRDLIVAGLCPVPDALEVVAFTVTAERVLLLVSVPRQNEETKPYLVRYLVDFDDKRIRGFGWPVRVDDAVVWQPCEQFQTRLSLGALIQAALAERSARPARPPVDDERHLRLIEALDDSGPSLVLRMIPNERVDLTPAMFGAHAIAAEVRNRRPLRQRGFHLIPHDTTDVRGLNGIEWGSRWRTAIDMDGVVMMASRVNDMALGWNMARHGPAHINPFTLTEITNDFYRLFYEIVLPRSGLTIGCWSAELIALEMRVMNAQLAAGWSRFPDDRLETATSDSYRRSLTPSGNADSDTYTTMVLFYALFGLGP